MRDGEGIDKQDPFLATNLLHRGGVCFEVAIDFLAVREMFCGREILEGSRSHDGKLRAVQGVGLFEGVIDEGSEFFLVAGKVVGPFEGLGVSEKSDDRIDA